jgi:molybdopterin-guanine dinucleotide biosynthesis protein A
VRPDQDDDTPDTGIALGMHVVTDSVAGGGPLAAFHAGLAAAATPLAFVTGADHPFLSRKLVLAMEAAAVSGGARELTAVVPRSEGILHPMHAVYPVADWLAGTSQALAAGMRSPRRLVEEAVANGQPPVMVMTEDEIEAYDPQLLSLFDIDTQEQLAVARRVASSWGPAPRQDIRPGGL